MAASQPAELFVDRQSPERLRSARRWLASVLGERDSASELVLTELVTNAIEHGADGPIHVSVAVDHDGVVELGVTNEITESVKVPLSVAGCPSVDGERGRGIYLVRALAELEPEIHTNQLTMRARVNRST